MVGSDDLYTGSVSTVDDFADHCITGEDFDVDQIDITALCSLQVELGIGFRCDCFLTAFLGSTESHQDRCVSEHLAQILQYVDNLLRFKYVLKPVCTPLNDVDRKRIESLCLSDDLFLCDANDRNNDFRCSGADFQVSYFYGIHGRMFLSLNHIVLF